MTVQSAQSVTVLFTTRVFSTGVATNADSLPTGTLYLNGTANGATVTVTNVTTGIYKAAVTMPTLNVGDEVEILISATVSSISDNAVIWGDTKDFIGSSGVISANATQLAGQTVTAAAGVTFPSSVASPTNITAGTITTVSGNVTGSVGSVTSGVTVTTNNDKTGYALTNAAYAAVMTQQMTESYAGLNVVPTPAQALFEMRALLAQNSVVGTTVTVTKIDGVTTAETFTINSATAPTSITRAS